MEGGVIFRRVSKGALLLVLSSFLIRVPSSHSAENVILSLDPKLRLYSESTYISQSKNLVQFSKLDAQLIHILDALHGYIGTRFSQDTQTTQTHLYNDNYLAATLGLEFHPPKWPLTFFVEHQQVFHVIKKPANRPAYETDFRAGALLYYKRDLTLIPHWVILFSETYAELIYSTRLDYNLYFLLTNKLGPRLSLVRAIDLDVYVEGFFKRDGLGFAGQNAEEVRFGSRLTAHLNPVSVAVSIHRGFGLDLFQNQPYQEWRGLLVLYAEI